MWKPNSSSGRTTATPFNGERREKDFMHSFFMPEIPVPGTVFRLPEEEENHLFRILRGRSGERVRLLNGAGCRGMAQILSGRELQLESREEIPFPALKLVLACAAPRRQKLDGLLKQAAELGVMEIHFMQCIRSVAKPEDKERWRNLLAEACKQSGNVFLPKTAVHGSVAETLESLEKGAKLYYGAVIPPEEPFPPVPGKGTVVFFAGPEGGFTEEEEALLQSAGAHGISLGPWILRLETAAAAGVAVLRAAAK